MTQYIRYFIFLVSLLLSITGYAVDHIICNLTSSEISGQVHMGQIYNNTYTCSNTYNSTFPPLQLGLVTRLHSGSVSSLTITGSCADAPLAPGYSCQFKVGVSLQQSVSFGVEITVGNQYFLNLGEVAAAAESSPPTIPTKMIAFYNNTSETIFPVIQVPVLTPTDAWLQAQFQITNINVNTFASTKIYRAYVNSTNGIPPGQTVLVSVPFYSELVAHPANGSIPDQYVDWWNAMRIYIYDVQSAVTQQYLVDSANPVTLFTPGPQCLPGAVCSQPLEVFSSKLGIPDNSPIQLLEYTFADVVTSVGVPYPIDTTHVDYDYSGVDQIYLPVALEPYVVSGSSLIGYTGTVVDLSAFRLLMNDFLTDTGWPVYRNLPYPRIPGAYNVVSINPDLTEPAKTNTTNMLETYWTNCLIGGHPYNAQCMAVNSLFQTNYTQCFGGGTPTTLELIQHIYGWAAFTGACGLNPLASTLGYAAAESAYHQLQYIVSPDYADDFNPYVQLVHVTLSMNVYAYSIDDAVGNINTIGDGIVITVGGANGLTNPLQYNTANVTTVGPGTPPIGSPDAVFTKFGVCSSTASSGSLARGAPFSFQIPGSQYPCEITLQDSNNLLYHFTVLSPAPFPAPPTSNYISCAAGDTWCAGVTIDFGTHVNIGTPVPKP